MANIIAVFSVVLIWTSSLTVVPYVLDGYWLPKQVVWATGSLAIAALGLLAKPLRRDVNFALMLFLIWCAYLFHESFLWFRIHTFLTEQSFDGNDFLLNWNVTPIIPYITILGSILFIHVTKTRLESRHWLFIARFVGLASFAIAVIGWCQYVGIDFVNEPSITHGQQGLPVYYPVKGQPGTTFGNPMASAVFLAIASPLLLSIPKAGWPMFAVNVVLLLAMQGGNSGSLIALYIGMMCFAWMNHRKAFMVMLAGLICASPIIVHSTLGGRIEAWQTIWLYWHSSGQLWNGLGLGTIQTLAFNKGFAFYPLHNDLFQLLVETGRVGLGLFSLALIILAARAFRKASYVRSLWCTSGLVYALTSLFAFPSHTGSTLGLGCLAWAALEGEA